MSNEALIAIIGVAAALLGSVSGSIASYISTRSMRRMEWKLSIHEKSIERHRTLYNDFLSEANRLMLLSFGNKVNDSTDFSKIAAMESQIRMSSLKLGEMARKITSCTMSYNVRDNSNVQDNFPALRDEFIEVCRQEIEAAIQANA